jgi:hypothetical protein
LQPPPPPPKPPTPTKSPGKQAERVSETDKTIYGTYFNFEAKRKSRNLIEHSLLDCSCF